MDMAAGRAFAGAADPTRAGFWRADPVPPDAGALSELKAYLRIDGSDDDALLGRLLAAAIAHGEAFTGQLMIARAVVETLRVCPEWRRLGATPVVAITSVTALPLAGEPVPLGLAAYGIDIDANGDGWVRVLDAGGIARVGVRYTAGLASAWAGLPEPLRQGALRLASHLYSHRDAADEGAPPAAVAALWRPWRRMRLQ